MFLLLYITSGNVYYAKARRQRQLLYKHHAVPNIEKEEYPMREVRDRYEIFLKVCETGNFTKAARR